MSIEQLEILDQTLKSGYKPEKKEPPKPKKMKIIMDEIRCPYCVARLLDLSSAKEIDSGISMMFCPHCQPRRAFRIKYEFTELVDTGFGSYNPVKS